MGVNFKIKKSGEEGLWFLIFYMDFKRKVKYYRVGVGGGFELREFWLFRFWGNFDVF